MSDEAGSLYEKVLNRAAAPGLPPVRPSAAVIPWRKKGDGIEVFWVRRGESLPFMGGWHAFPGGGLSRSDATVPVEGEPSGVGELPPAAGFPESLVQDPGPDLLPGLAACAIRELHEETGLLLEDASRLVWAGRWLTPPFAPVRFDNRFFLLEWPETEPSQPAVVGPGELAEGEWIDPQEAWQSWRDGKVLVAPPILHILDVLAHDGPAAGLGRLRDPSETNLGPFRRIEMRHGLLMYPLATHTLPPASTTNCYLLGTDECVLIDPGSPLEVELERLERSLAVARERLGRRVTAIWLTHHHPDHVGGVERLRRSLNVPVLAHPATAERLAGRGIRIDGELHDKQKVTLAGDPPMTILVIHTPGHARGHLCFLEEEQRATLVGDLVAGLGTIVIDPPEGDMDDYIASLARLAMMHPRILFPAHGPAILDGHAKLREYVDHRLWRESKVLEAWNEGLREPAEMLPKVYEDTPKEAWPLAERQILAHLDRLRRMKRLEEWSDGEMDYDEP